MDTRKHAFQCVMALVAFLNTELIATPTELAEMPAKAVIDQTANPVLMHWLLELVLNNESPSTSHDEPLYFSVQQRLIADQFINIFEYGGKEIQYAQAENIDDNRGITAGRAGFTTATGDMYELILEYSAVTSGNLLFQYVEELLRLKTIRYTPPRSEAKDIASSDTSGLPNLVSNWQETALRQDFKDAQDAYVDEHYFNRALDKARILGSELPLTLLSLYDANIMHGESGLDALVETATQMTEKLTPAQGGNEIQWLKNFNINRRQVMKDDPTGAWGEALARIDELEDLITEGNFQLQPFVMHIQRYGGETHQLP